ncbi:unnamed protein product [Cyprideis torosa]|uniref:Uncharacterized protein n=1 Tax=Cyprideis torosa TaxID=163714 RepID=A0A7R8WEL0_9CRUS|nr:unnamed protein product [Cyprideis torosa]CAG0895765.1 unnamed protein product [Cyprideis torosa]
MDKRAPTPGAGDNVLPKSMFPGCSLVLRYAAVKRFRGVLGSAQRVFIRRKSGSEGLCRASRELSGPQAEIWWRVLATVGFQLSSCVEVNRFDFEASVVHAEVEARTSTFWAPHSLPLSSYADLTSATAADEYNGGNGWVVGPDESSVSTGYSLGTTVRDTKPEGGPNVKEVSDIRTHQHIIFFSSRLIFGPCRNVDVARHNRSPPRATALFPATPPNTPLPPCASLPLFPPPPVIEEDAPADDEAEDDEGMNSAVPYRSIFHCFWHKIYSNFLVMRSEVIPLYTPSYQEQRTASPRRQQPTSLNLSGPPRSPVSAKTSASADPIGGQGVGGGAAQPPPPPLSHTMSSSSLLLPWGAKKESVTFPIGGITIDVDLRPGEFVMRTLFAEFTVLAEKKIEAVLAEPLDRPLAKSLQRGEDAGFDQLLSAFGSVSEHCLPSLLRTLFAWYDRQGVDAIAHEHRLKHEHIRGKMEERFNTQEKRDLAVKFIFCLVLIEVLKMLPFHPGPGHDDMVEHIQDIAFRHFKYREGDETSANAANLNIISDLFAEVIGVLAQSRFFSVKKRFMAELADLRAREPSVNTTQSIVTLLMGMKFFRVKMVPIEEFESCFQFLHELGSYFLEVKEKDIRHALAGLFVEVLMPVASSVKNEVNVPVLKSFVEKLYSQTLDMSTKKKQSLALYPLVTCILCVSQKNFFLSNWHHFLTMCLQQLKNTRDPKMSRVALESLYRLIWVYMIRIKCESNTATHSRLQSIVNSLFPKGSKGVVPRDAPLNIFVKIIHFIAQERLDFAMREIVFELLSVGRPIKVILTPERMSIGLRSFMVIADNLQQKEGEPPMPRTAGVMPSGSTMRIKKTFLNKVGAGFELATSEVLTEDAAKTIGIQTYFPHVKKVFSDILRALDSQFGRPLMMTHTQNANKVMSLTDRFPSSEESDYEQTFLSQEPVEMITDDRKPKIDLFRTSVAAIPRLIPEGMSKAELIDLLCRLTVHMDEELRGHSCQSLQNIIVEFPEWRDGVITGYIYFLIKEITDSFISLWDSGIKILYQLLSSWKNALPGGGGSGGSGAGNGRGAKRGGGVGRSKVDRRERKDSGDGLDTQKFSDASLLSVLRLVEGVSLVLLCSMRQTSHRLALALLREVKALAKLLGVESTEQWVIDAMESLCPEVAEALAGPADKASSLDMQWLSDKCSAFYDPSQELPANARFLSLSVSLGDAWSNCLIDFLSPSRLPSLCPSALLATWPLIHSRITSLFPLVDPK